jgi:hypothetical protein
MALNLIVQIELLHGRDSFCQRGSIMRDGTSKDLESSVSGKGQRILGCSSGSGASTNSRRVGNEELATRSVSVSTERQWGKDPVEGNCSVEKD